MTAEEAKIIAADYLASNPIENKDYVWTVAQPKQTDLGWYFDFEYRCLLDLRPEDWEMFGAAPGFLIRSDRTVKVVGWDNRTEMLLPKESND